ncbi:MAG: hypothetical protein HY321_12115 [Armatimonadetes bacterium]|nr:hypothetical protein [Armatimonadota bacterium]
MRDGLQRLGIAFSDLKSLDGAPPEGCRVLVLSGTRPPVKEADKETIRRFVEGGGAVLAVGGGARCLIDLGLFDAGAYTMTGTTLHNTSLDGCHRLTFGYPAGVPDLLRATDGPFMEVGPRATSIIRAGGPYSLAAIQRLGKGYLLSIGADPQGGRLFTDVDKFRPVSGKAQKTDGLLANAIAFLLDPRGNLIPDPGFEDALPYWEVTARGGARSERLKNGAAEGKVCLKLACPGAKATAEARPARPVVIERGETYTFRCQYKATAPWKVSWQFVKAPGRNETFESGPVVDVPASEEWRRFDGTLIAPSDVAYVRPVLSVQGTGELLLDAVTLSLDGESGQP